MDIFLAQIPNLPIPTSLIQISPDVQKKIKNFQSFFRDITKDTSSQSTSEADDTERRELLDSVLFTDEIDDNAKKALYIFSKMVLPSAGRTAVEEKVRALYGYSEEHSAKILRYLEFLELAYAGKIDFAL
jgi:hypothetical protein